jgi:hypothetical protein
VFLSTRISRFATSIVLASSVLAISFARAQERERVAVLYAADNQALHRIDPDTGEFTKIGDLQLSSFVRAYDAKREMLYAMARSDQLSNFLFQIDPKTAEETMVWEAPQGQPPMWGASYDPKSRTLYRFLLGDGNRIGVLQPFDFNSGQFGPDDKNPLLPDCYQVIFDNRGDGWYYDGTDTQHWLRKFTGTHSDDHFFISVPTEGQLPATFPDLAPAYWVFSFQPYTGTLFALATPLVTFQDPNTGERWVGLDYEHFMLCTVSLTTGKPVRIIAVYDRPTDPDWFLTIAWGF